MDERELQRLDATRRCASEMDDLIKDFLQESRENLDHLDQDFVKLESDPGDRELLKSIVRTIRTIKGTCGFLGFRNLEALTHAGESLLSLLRDGEMALHEACADALLEMVDAVRGYLEAIESTEAEGTADTTGLIARLKRLQERRGKQGQLATTSTAPRPAVAVPDREAKRSKSVLTEEKPAVVPEHNAEAEAPAKGEQPEASVKVNEGNAKAQESKSAEMKDATIRVDVNLLEKQMNLVSELVLLRNRLLQLALESNERNLNATVHGLNYVTSELRKNVMKTRMQPVSQLFDKLPRILRDISGESSAEIGQVIKVITSIAQKTDLLALNATVEAARAGEVGAGFAVVANEVKELAKQTATATEDISRKIEAIQTDAKAAVKAIGSITEVIGQVNNISGTIATAVEEQSATTSEMSRNVSEAAKGSGEVAQNIQGVAQAAESTSHGATDSLKAAKSLAEMSTQLRELVGRFKLENERRATRRKAAMRTEAREEALEEPELVTR